VFKKRTIPPSSIIHAVELTANRLLCGKRFVKSQPEPQDKAITCKVCLRFLSRFIPTDK
jgi:hypothetical protein